VATRRCSKRNPLQYGWAPYLLYVVVLEADEGIHIALRDDVLIRVYLQILRVYLFTNKAPIKQALLIFEISTI
jgi:hypothetical protein